MCVCVCLEGGNALGQLSLILGINVVSFAVEIIEAQHLGHHQSHLNVEGLHRSDESKMEQIRISEHKITVERVSSRLSSSQHKLFMFCSLNRCLRLFWNQRMFHGTLCFQLYVN